MGNRAAGWGLLPSETVDRLREREWLNRSNLRQRLSGERSFPIHVSLNAPSGPQAATDIERFRSFVIEWSNSPIARYVQWQDVDMRKFGRQRVPTSLEVPDVRALAEIIGGEAPIRLEHWLQRVEAISLIDSRMRGAAIRCLGDLSELSDAEFTDLCVGLPQLRRSMAAGMFVRATPLSSVGTKFVEHYEALLTRLLAARFSDDPPKSGGLLEWIGARPIPASNIVLRPLCTTVQERMLGAAVLWTTSRDLMSMSLPADRVLVVENATPCFSLPPTPGVLALGGGGGDVSFLRAPWARDRRLAYWGDIDTWGFHWLSRARALCCDLPSLMMDAQTFRLFKHRASSEPTSCPHPPAAELTASEIEALRLIGSGPPHNRLEQEYLSEEHISHSLHHWATTR